MASTKDKQLDALMGKTHDVGAGQPIDLESLVDSPLVEAGAFYEPFWDPGCVDSQGNTHGVDGEDYAANAWDCVQLGEWKLPGIWTATATPAIKLDVQKPLGYDGAAVITRGYLPAGVTLTGTLWTPMQFRILQDVFPGIWRKPFKVHAQDVQRDAKGKVRAVEKDQGEIIGEQRSLAIVNPALNMMGIFYVVIQKPTPLVACEIVGARRMTIECMEYVPEPAVKPSAVKKTKGTKETSRGANAFDKAIEQKDARKPKPPGSSAKALEP